MKNKYLILASILMLAAFLTAGCNNTSGIIQSKDLLNTDDVTPLSDAVPDITGEILDVSTKGSLAVLVDSTSENTHGQVWVSVGSDVQVFDAQGNEIYPDDISSLFVIGESITFLSDGMYMESYPMQTNAVCVYLDK